MRGYPERKAEMLEKNPFLSSSEVIYTILLEDILDNRISEDTKLVQDAVAQSFGMSRTPVREALARLQAEGFIEKGSGQFYVPYSLHASDYAQMTDFRIAIECAIVRYAAMFISSGNLALLQKNLEKMQTILNAPKLMPLVDLDAEFHHILAASCQNKYLLETYTNYEMKMRLFRMLALKNANLQVSVHSAYQRHVQVYKALQVRDEDAAVEAMKKHISLTGRYSSRFDS